MTKRFLFILSFPLLLAACKKNHPGACSYTETFVRAPEVQITALSYALADRGITTATKDTSGIFYEIINPGTGTQKANVCSTITVQYTGKLFSTGAVFDSNTTTEGASFVLGGLIAGWKAGIPLIKEGGTIRLYIPPYLGYGTATSGAIPANSQLIFDITLLSVK